MHVNGNLSIAGLLKDLKVEQIVEDPTDPVLSRVWFNTTEGVLKYFDGSEVQSIAKGGNLGDYLKLDGTAAMIGELQLNSSDQSDATDVAAVSKGYLDTVAATKQNNITGAASSVTVDNLSSSRVAVTNENGKLAASTTVTASEVEHLSGTTANVQEQLNGKEPTIGYTPVNKAGDSMTGTLSMGGNVVSGVGAPLEATDAVRKVDLETALLGLDFQADILDRQIDDTLDPGTAPTEGDRYIIGGAAALHANFGAIEGVENGDIVSYDGEKFVVDYDASAQGEGALVWNRGRDTFQFYNGAVWADFGGLSGVTAGTGLAKDGNNIFVDMGAGVTQLPSEKLGLDLRPNSGLLLTEDGLTASTSITAQLAVLPDSSTLENSENGLRAKASGITETHINGSVAGNGLLGGDGAKLGVKTFEQSGVTVTAEGVSVDRTELRNTFLARDGAEAMTGELHLSSDDQSASTSVTAVSKGHLDGALSVVDQSIADLATRMENGYFLYEEMATPAVAHTVTHGMGTKYVQVQVVDESDEVIIPESITYTDGDSLTVTFTQAATCRIIVTGIKAVVAPAPAA